MTRKKQKTENGTVTVAHDSPVSEARNCSSHRTCWVHMASFLHRWGGKLRIKELARMKLASPCYELVHHHCPESHCALKRKRSERRIKRKYVIPREIGPNKKLSSEVFDAYFEYLWANFAEDKKTSFACLESIWFHYYTTRAFREKVLTWIKGKEIFSKKYVLVPIVHWGHWNLLILCHLGENFESKAKTPCILLLDSLEMANPKRYEPVIRKFVLDIHRAEGRAENKKQISQIQFLTPQVPQQRNNADCGNYVLYFMNLFLQNAPDNFSIKDYPYFMKRNWFTHECLERFFAELESFQRRKLFFEQMKSVKYDELC